MEVYFVRHGQTGGNLAKRHQSEESHLTPLGKKQAQTAAKRIAQLEPTHVMVSDRVRAIETAQYIAKQSDLIPSVSYLFSELCRPAALYGYHHRSRSSLWYIYQWYRGKAGENSCSKNGESYQHFFGRVKKAQAILETLPKDARVVVVSHSIFINFFVAHLNSTAPINFTRAFLIFTKILRIKNGSITHLQFSVGQSPNWKVVTYGQQTVLESSPKSGTIVPPEQVKEAK